MMPSPLVTQTPIGADTRVATSVVAVQADAGTTLYIPFTATYLADGSPVTLTGTAIVCSITTQADHLAADTVVATLSLAGGTVLLTGSNAGRVVVAAALTSGVVGYSVWNYQIAVTLGDGTVWVIQSGTIAVTAGNPTT